MAHQKVLLTGPTGFIGKRLLYQLDERGYQVRCLVRAGETLDLNLPLRQEPEIVYADLLDPDSLPTALDGMDTAYYLVHSMGGRSIRQTRAFVEKDRTVARNFREAADRAGLSRIIYLGGLGDAGDRLSHHLASRHEVARILQAGKVKTTVLRAAVIIGAGGASFEIIRYLVERLPVLLGPRWVYTKSQPIAVENVLAYLCGCLETPETAGRTFDIGGPQILSYADLMGMYARVRGLSRTIIGVPLVPIRLSAYWVHFITPVPVGVVLPLAEGLRNRAICRENSIRDLIPIHLTPMETAICNALAEETEGPGKLLSQQACFLPGDLA
ncbi:NAD(P)H-binding protein [Desulfosudis oleivorans]|uniref:NAD-dependent epimerase/dehydratase n=1 Tax=Desulfosudis oleivorans (strain DSM 6200 / JCM 39069 / Hxd3) TaxID=96561 RepID=A8ZSQ4_DESOH|nr:NAD(P)H-binding protein [Desulfosudis oleivorans]ABW65967.1 NAD-dependent epimerase/dehydratase [Desulfosudis oleivorans Hxd3]